MTCPASILRLICATFVASALACIASPPALAAVIDVYVFNFEFSVNPEGQSIVDPVITVGDTIRWIHAGGNHTTTAVAGIPEQWNSPITSSVPVFQHTFTQIGTWHYYCIPHGVDNGNQTASGMAGIVTVLPNTTGACCLGGGTCMVMSPAACLSAGGTFQGDGTSCTPNPCPNQPVMLTLGSVQDAVIHESVDGTIANGSGQQLYAGNQNSGLKRRIAIKFDLSSIPAGAMIQSASLELYCNSNTGAAVNVAAHRLLNSWTEGPSDPTGNEGSGATAVTGDVTWLHRTYTTVFWNAAGGDYHATASASASVNAQGVFHAWAGAGLIADLQQWVNNSATNHGWILLGDELTANNTKRFDSRQSGTVANRPRLQITYHPPGGNGACCLTDGSCTDVSEMRCMSMGGTWQGEGTMCSMTSCPIVLTPYLDPLPLPGVAMPVTGVPGGAAHYEIVMTEFFQQLHSQLPPTRVWGYGAVGGGGTYPGPTIEARRSQPVSVNWHNDLRVAETNVLRTTHPLTVHECMHGPDMWGQVPVTVVHLHGGFVTPESDGHPDLAFPPGQSSPTYHYPNNQPAATVWYHDHALGNTRLNVMMGLAGLYLIRDAAEDALNIPRGEFEIPLVIQDRTFNADGSIHYPSMMMDHFFGNVALVNGKVWPYLNVKQGKYRFRVANGSNSRVWRLFLPDHETFWQIATDTGLMSAPVPLTHLTLAPGERADIVIDFAAYAPGTEIILSNDAPILFPGTSGVGVIANVMKFIVQAEIGHLDPLPATLVNVPLIPESLAHRHRTLELRLIADPHCAENPHGMWSIDGLLWDDITEMPRLDSVEVWAWKNRSAVTHPMHIHLVAFQVLDRREFDTVTGEPFGPLYPPEPNEIGWKDTVQAPPGMITRVITRFEGYEGLYPYHCHILEHEDHEMMRQFHVMPPCVADIAPAGNVDDVVNVTDLLAVIGAWGATSPNIADINQDGVINVTDLLAVIGAWGVCP